MANNLTNNITESFQNIFLAGVGALSIGGEKAKEVIDELVERGQVTVEQGRKLNEELKHKAAADASKMREDAVRAYITSLSPEDRAVFAQQMAEIAREINEREADEVIAEAKNVADSDTKEA